MILYLEILTGTLDGNASFVIHWILLIKFMVDILHSRASSWKWFRTSNVNMVLGFLKLARKSFAWRSWMYWSNNFMQWYHLTEHLKILTDDTMIRLDCDWQLVLQSVGSCGSNSSGSFLPASGISAGSGIEEQSSKWWLRSKGSLQVRRSDSSKNHPFHIWTQWNGMLLWLITQQELHQRLLPKQSLHWCVPDNLWQFVHSALDGKYLCWRSAIKMLWHWIKYSSRKSFWVCRHLSNYHRRYMNIYGHLSRCSGTFGDLVRCWAIIATMLYYFRGPCRWWNW